MKTALRENVLRHFLLMTLGCLAWSQANARCSAQRASERRKTAKHAKPGKVAALNDHARYVATRPKWRKWAAEAKARCEKFYPTIVSQLGGPNSRQPLSVTITFRKGRGIAGTAGTHIVCNAEWFTAASRRLRRRDPRTVPRGAGVWQQDVPGWVTEGIADYVRWFKFEPARAAPASQSRHGQVHRRLSDHGRVFRLDRAHEKQIVRPTPERGGAEAASTATSCSADTPSKPLDELWAEYIDSLRERKYDSSHSRKTQEHAELEYMDASAEREV